MHVSGVMMQIKIILITSYTLKNKEIDFFQKIDNVICDNNINDSILEKNEYQTITINGLAGSLPLQNVDDMDIIQLFIHANTETTFMGHEKIYVLFKIKEIKKEWIEIFLNLLKKKISRFLIFGF